jgi:hypothetical protein
VGERGPESDVNLLIKQLSKFDKKQKFQGDKGYQGAERTTIPKKSRESKNCQQKSKKIIRKKPKKEYL